MHPSHRPGKDRAALVGLVADRHDDVKGDVEQFADVLAAVPRDVHPGLRHHLDGPGVQSVGLDPRGPGIDGVCLECACPPLSHLAAAGVAGAEKQDLESCHRQASFPALARSSLTTGSAAVMRSRRSRARST